MIDKKLKRHLPTRAVTAKTAAKKLSGFALITILGMVMVISLAVSNLIYKEYFDIKRSANMLNESSALQIGWAIESWVKTGLIFDAVNTKFDALTEAWAQPVLRIPFAGGTLSGNASDATALFNLNTLNAKDINKANIYRNIFSRLMLILEIKDINLTNLILDWIDANTQKSDSGAEDDIYLSKNPPYRTPNQNMVIADEIFLLNGVSLDIANKILPFIIALPSSDNTTKININTVKKEVLMAISSEITGEVADAWITHRTSEPAAKLYTFKTWMQNNSGIPSGTINKIFPSWLIDTNSNYFLVSGKLSYGRSNLLYNVLFYRDGKKSVSSLARWYNYDLSSLVESKAGKNDDAETDDTENPDKDDIESTVQQYLDKYNPPTN